MMTKQVTKTTIVIAKMEMQDGIPVAVSIPNEVVIGNIKIERAQRMVDKLHGAGATVLEVHADTETYEMSVEDFINIASIKEPIVEKVASE